MTSEPMTTIKVPKRLRERIARDAAREGVTAAGYLAMVLTAHERAARFAAVRAVYAAGDDQAYGDELAQWDALAGDGLAE